VLRAIFLIPIFLSSLSAQTTTSYVASAGYAFPNPTAVARGQVITLFVRGVQVPNATAGGSPWPTMLGGVTVAVANPPTPAYPTALPIFSVFSSPSQCAGGNYQYCNTTAVTVQIPVEPACIPTSFPDSCSTFSGPVTNLVVHAGAVSEVFPFVVVGQSPHVLNTCDTIFGNGGVCTPVITHANGTAVSTTAPAQPGEIVTLYGVGLGATQNGTGTGQAAAAPDPVAAPPYLSFGFWIDTPAAALSLSGPPTPAGYAGLVSGYVGLYQINVSLPSRLPPSFHTCQGFGDTSLRIFLGSEPAPSQVSEVPFVDLCMAQ
jgi:uncharacterized protein (TIGR03437 family)